MGEKPHTSELWRSLESLVEKGEPLTHENNSLEGNTWPYKHGELTRQLDDFRNIKGYSLHDNLGMTRQLTIEHEKTTETIYLQQLEESKIRFLVKNRSIPVIGQITIRMEGNGEYLMSRDHGHKNNHIPSAY